MNRMKIYLMVLIGITACVSFYSCKKYADPPRYFEEYGADSLDLDTKLRKVLFISIDGVSGDIMEELAPANYTRLKESGKYSGNVIFPTGVATDASSWISLLTGVGYGKHQIKDSSFTFVPESETPDEDMDLPDNYPIFFNYLFQTKPDYKYALVTPWEELANFTTVLDESYAVTDDREVKDSAVALIKRSKSLGVLVADFTNAEHAGMEGGFTLDNEAYKQAIEEADGYISDLTDALKERANYEEEEWLIALTTNHGGSPEEPENGFIVFSNERLQPEEVKPRGLNLVKFTGANENAVSATLNPISNGKRVYDFQSDFTIQFEGLFGSKNGSYPPFFGNKFELNGGSTPGFSFLIDFDPTWTFNTTTGSKFQVATNKSILYEDGWHTLGITVEKNSSGSRIVTAYLDGEKMNDGTLPAAANLNNDDIPLTVGWISSSSNGDYQEINLYGLKFFDKALSEEDMQFNREVEEYTEVREIDHLTGYWAFNDAAGGTIKNSINPGLPFILRGNFEWKNMGNEVPSTVEVPDEVETGASIAPIPEDVVSNIFYWLDIEPSSDWNLDGQPWLANFENEIYDL